MVGNFEQAYLQEQARDLAYLSLKRAQIEEYAREYGEVLPEGIEEFWTHVFKTIMYSVWKAIPASNTVPNAEVMGMQNMIRELANEAREYRDIIDNFKNIVGVLKDEDYKLLQKLYNLEQRAEKQYELAKTQTRRIDAIERLIG